jgi:acetylornithine/N-succinyldiaminopimelate aminotransferase
MTLQSIKALYDNYVMNTYSRFDVAIEKGDGAAVYDTAGKKYIDFSSGIGVNSVGYNNKKWTDAVTEQARKLQHTSNLFFTLPGAELAEKLCKISGMGGVFFSNSGAEANEAMIKLARKYSFDNYGGIGRNKIITLEQSFHGRTITTLAATGQDKFHNYFFPFTEGFEYVPADDISALEAAGDEKTCAVMLETIQGEGGVLPVSGEYILKVSELCKKNDWLLLIDEVQTGCGRTGSYFSYLQLGVTPDVVSFAKGVAGGLPFGGILCLEKHKGVLSPGTHATTFGMNPICANAALAVYDILVGDGVMDTVEEKGGYIRKKIEDMGLKGVRGTRGKGLMIGISVDFDAAAAVKEFIANGLLAITAGSAIRFLPPLTISYEEIDEGLKIFKDTIGRMS